MNEIPKGTKIVDITGKRFHRLLVIGFDRLAEGTTFWHVRCDCGREKVMRRSNFNGSVKSNSNVKCAASCKSEGVL